MKIGPRYKICRTVGDRVFDKCQSPKFEMTAPGHAAGRKRGGRRTKSEYGQQLLEKQKVRYTYGVGEKQFARYVAGAAKTSRGASPVEKLYASLELRLDNAAYQMGIASSRQHARQLVTHGHLRVNGRKVDIPSYQLRAGDVVDVRPERRHKPVFADLKEKLAERTPPAWLSFDQKEFRAEIQGVPKFEGSDSTFNLKSVIEFYSR